MPLDDTQDSTPGHSSRSTRHPEAGRGRPPARASGGSTPQSAPQETAVDSADRLTGRVDAAFGQPTTVSTDALSATLLGVPRIAVDAFVYRHQLDSQTDGEIRPSALFDVENTSSRPIRWDPNRTSFIGSDGYTYRGAHITLDPSRLGPGCHTRSVEIQPGCRARVMTLVERLPEGVEVARIVHSVSSRRHADQRLTFELQ
ncbi:hypothetical protein [Halohasta salina]|uniref:hypothetical protein n=1 Tax=Halohasta salina TaxID=2961621 RepID=UPI0020A38978|nr:hypothetical protein [Halohasta salina]